MRGKKDDAELAEPPEFDAPEPEDPDYRRRRRPVPVRKRRPVAWLGAVGRRWRALAAGAAALVLAYGMYSLVFRSAWFVVQGTDQIAVYGAQQTRPAAVLRVFSADLGRNVFFIPLEERREQIEKLPWVNSATVMRIWPARLQVSLVERKPVAFARRGDDMELIAADGALLPPPPKSNYAFPVLTGLAATAAARRAQVARYLAFAQAVHDPGISEVDVADANDLQARTAVPGGGTVLVHYGDANYAARYALFAAQIAGWKEKYPNLVSVDLHYDGQAIVNPGEAPAAQAPARPAAPAAKAANAAKRSGKGHRQL